MQFDELEARMRVYETSHDHCVLPGVQDGPGAAHEGRLQRVHHRPSEVTQLCPGTVEEIPPRVAV